MKVHLLKCACMCPMGGRLPSFLLPHALTCNCLLIETSAGLVLVDTGIGLADMADPRRLGLISHFLGLKRTPADTALQQVIKLGYSPADVTHIIPTHLDLDHAGGLPDFPNATVHVLNLEKTPALSPSGFIQKERYRACHWQHHPKWQTYDLDTGESWHGFSRVKALTGLPPEILLVSLPGHTAGHAGIAISSSAGWLLHAGDAYYDRRQMLSPPKITAGMRVFQRIVHQDFELATQTLEKLRQTCGEDANMQVICAHDANETIANGF